MNSNFFILNQWFSKGGDFGCKGINQIGLYERHKYGKLKRFLYAQNLENKFNFSETQAISKQKFKLI